MTSFVVLLADRPVFRGRVGGFVVPLRLAITAQRGGARSIHLAPGAERLAPWLVDPRLTIPVNTAPPPDDAVVIEVPGDVVLHEAALPTLAEAVGDGRARSLGTGESRVEARPPVNARTSLGPAVPLVFARPFAFPPMRVARFRDAVRANTALLRACRKPRDGWTSTYLNRHISLNVTRFLLHLGLHPNHVTLGIVALGVASGVVAARGEFLYAAALLQLQSTLDGCDGELARMTFRETKLGEWLDTIGDDLSNSAFFAGASFGMFDLTGKRVWLILGAVTVGVGGLASAIEYRYLARIGSGDLLAYPLADGGRIATALQPLFKRDTFILITLIAAALGMMSGVLVVSAIGAIAIFIAVLRTEARLAT